MFRKNKRSQQPLLLSDVHDLPERSFKLLTHSWAATFRQEVFLRIDEERFSVLYSPQASRPNIPVNILMGLEILKGGRNWTDEEMYEHFLFDLQVRYALGCDNFGQDDFDLRSVYYFRRRLVAHALDHNENLVAELFAQVTDEQIAQLGLKTDQQRMDSTMLMSNIADLSRLELLIEVLQRLWRILSEEDQVKYTAVFQPYVKESAGQYAYRLKGREGVWEHIRQVGQVLQRLLGELAERYGQEAVFGVAQRFFDENFVIEANAVRAKQNQEITSGCLQSVDDLEATYRQKGKRGYKGYVANLAETCHPDNPVQLIDQVQVAPNLTSDIHLLQEGIEELKQRTGVETLVTDGAYVSPQLDPVLRDHQVRPITTGLTGTLPDHTDGKLALSDFEMPQDDSGQVTAASCPLGVAAHIESKPGAQSFRLTFPAETCRACPHGLAGQCPVKPDKSQQRWQLSVPHERANSSQRRRRFEQCKQEARNLRTAIEATVFQVKHTWVQGKLRVRGLFRVTNTVICSALAVNLRRIDRYFKGRLRGKLTARPRPQGMEAAGAA